MTDPIPAAVECECGETAVKDYDNVLTGTASYQCPNGHTLHRSGDGEIELLND